MQFRVEEDDGIRYLLTSDSAVQSALNLQHPEQLIMQNLEYLMGCLMFIPQPKKILILGIAGGSLIHFFRHHLPNTHITAVDIDGDFIEQMYGSFSLPKADKNLRYEIADAQTWVAQTASKFDLIIVDLFNENTMPPWVLEQPFMQNLNDALNPKACVAWNTLISSEHEFNQFYNHLRLVFQQRTLCLSAESYENTLAYSFNFDLKQPDMGTLIEQAQKHTHLYNIPFHRILNTIFSTNPIDSGFI